MISRWKAGLIFSLLATVLLTGRAGSETIAGVIYSGMEWLNGEQLQGNSLLKEGKSYSDSLLRREVSRLDSMYFNQGLLDWKVSIDTFRVDEGLKVEFRIDEGEATLVGEVNLTASGPLEEEQIMELLGVREGSRFNPSAIGRSMNRVLRRLNDRGYPYAQVWITEYTYQKGLNRVDLSFSVSPGSRARISSVVFDGISRTDTSTALSFSRLNRGELYSESAVRRAVDYLTGSGYFKSVGGARVKGGFRDGVIINIPLEEKEKRGSFEGAFGFSRKDNGDYLLNGSVDVRLNNIAGTGRNVDFDWLNDGRNYSRIRLEIFEPFLLGMPVHLNAEIGQTVQDSVYTRHSGGLYFNLPVRPGFSVYLGTAADRNISDTGELLRSVRQRYRAGLSAGSDRNLSLRTHLEGAYKKKYLTGSRSDEDWQLIYRLETRGGYDFLKNQGCYCRFVSEGVVSSGDIHPAEMFPLGGASTLRGYRENQFRGEKIGFLNLEYRLGSTDRIFLFNDTATYYREDTGWKWKNGFGFGVRSVSRAGTVVLSFGVGDRISLKGTHIHIQLIESF